MTERLVVVGAGGFGRETLDVIEASNRLNRDSGWEIVGVVDSFPSASNLARLANRGVRYLGSEHDWLSGRDDSWFVVAIGDPAVRQQVAIRWELLGLRAASIVHPTAVIGSSSRIGNGTVVCAGALISTNVSLGRHVHINPGATVGHDAQLGDFVSVNPAAVVSGDVEVGSNALIGAGATILQGIQVGASAVVGAAACVVRAVPEGDTVKGIPAK